MSREARCPLGTTFGTPPALDVLRRRPRVATSHNLSACESKQTVADVWRPMPVTGYCAFHETRESEVLRPSSTGTTLGETLVRLGSPDVSSRRCIADSRHPRPEPDDTVHRAAAVPPIRGPGWHTLAGPTGSLFFARNVGRTFLSAVKCFVAERDYA